MIPFIPILAALSIIGGVSALVWYSNQTPEAQERADRAAIKWFGKRFADLSEAQKKRIRDEVDPPG